VSYVFLSTFYNPCKYKWALCSISFFLLPNKTTHIYELAFSFLKTKCAGLNLNLKLTTIVADFEDSIHAGAKMIWPLIQVIGCRFHLTQSWWRKIQEIRLTDVYKNKNCESGIWLRKIFGLSFLSPEEVSDCFIEEFMAHCTNDPKMSTFCDYLTENYIDEFSRFPSNVWASFSISSERTTNSCESFHAKLNSLFTKSHPNIFLFIHVLNTRIQTDTYIILRSTHKTKINKNTKYVHQKRKIEDLLKDYEAKKINRSHFIRLASSHYKK